MTKFSIMLFGIDSYTKENLYLPYKLEAKNANAAVREARKHAKSAYPEFIEDGEPDVEVVKRRNFLHWLPRSRTAVIVR